jgi:glycosyltransferase involved in cell wall biosynthesis
MTKSHTWSRNPNDARRDPHDFQDEPIDGALVSVIIPCYNQAHFLGEAIDSVLAQTYPRFEVIVVDDGSTDNTSEVARRYPEVRCTRQENRGLSAARNTGMCWSHGRYLVFLDADDRLLPIALEAGLECLSTSPESAFVFGHYELISADGSFLSAKQRPCLTRDLYAVLLRDNCIRMHATVMYRRAVLEYVGGFDTSLNACEDYELYLRVARKHSVNWHDKVVAQYRQHETQMVRNPTLMLSTSVSVLRSQWKYIEGSEPHEEAYKAGMTLWQSTYGILLVKQVLSSVRSLEWRQAIRGMLVLMRYPRTLPLAVKRARSKVMSYLHAHRRPRNAYSKRHNR